MVVGGEMVSESHTLWRCYWNTEMYLQFVSQFQKLQQTFLKSVFLSNRTEEERKYRKIAGWDWKTEGAVATHQVPARVWTTG